MIRPGIWACVNKSETGCATCVHLVGGAHKISIGDEWVDLFLIGIWSMDMI